MYEPFMGQITLFPYGFAPKNWAECLGQLLPIQQYTTLFSLLGTSFGGNGTTNFGLPDLRGRTGIGTGTGVTGTQYPLGTWGGLEVVSLDHNTMPAHGHPLAATQNVGTTNAPEGNILAAVFKGDFTGGDEGDIYNPGPANTSLMPKTLGQAGGNRPHNNVQPFLALRYCIALEGLFPHRP